MSLAIKRGPFFIADFQSQFGYYVDRANAKVAWRFHTALNATLVRLAESPELGRLRRFSHPMLAALRSYRVQRPFQKLLIFYRVEENALFAFRLMHSARDLPQRIIERPELK